MSDSSSSSGGFFGKLKDVLFEPEPEAKPPAAPPARGSGLPPAPPAPAPFLPPLTPAAAPAARAAAPMPMPMPASAAPAPATAPAAPAARNLMVDRMMELVLEKPSAYTALMEAIHPLEAFIPDEASRYKAAFGIVGKTRTLEQIVKAIDQTHLPTLQTESERFHGQAQNQQELQITARLREIEALRAAVAGAEDERKRIEARMRQIQLDADVAQQKIRGFEQEIASRRAEIVQINSQFESALMTVRKQLIDAKAKILRYLGA
jgi:hypothetical protein